MNFPDLINRLPEFHGRFSARQLDANNCTIYFASYPAGTAVEAHHHDTENVGCITQGTLILIRNGQEEYYGIGEWYHLNPGELHAARFDETTSEIEFWFEPGSLPEQGGQRG